MNHPGIRFVYDRKPPEKKRWENGGPEALRLPQELGCQEILFTFPTSHHQHVIVHQSRSRFHPPQSCQRLAPTAVLYWKLLRTRTSEVIPRLPKLLAHEEADFHHIPFLQRLEASEKDASESDWSCISCSSESSRDAMDHSAPSKNGFDTSRQSKSTRPLDSRKSNMDHFQFVDETTAPFKAASKSSRWFPSISKQTADTPSHLDFSDAKKWQRIGPLKFALIPPKCWSTSNLIHSRHCSQRFTNCPWQPCKTRYSSATLCFSAGDPTCFCFQFLSKMWKSIGIMLTFGTFTGQKLKCC